MNRNPSLDGIRALAALMVIAFHTRVPGFKGGYIGVDIFFVLSSYLITSLILAEVEQAGRFRYWRFLLRRTVRLMPLLLSVLLMVGLLMPLLWPDAKLDQEIVLPALYLTDFSRAFWYTPDITQHTWSLAVEAHFYLLWPFVLLLLFRWPERLIGALVLLFVAATLWRIVVTLSIYPHWLRAYCGFDTRLSGFVLGGLVAVLVRRSAQMSAWMVPLAMVILALATATLQIGGFPGMTWGGVIVDLAAAALIFAQANGSGVRWLATSSLSLLGRWSYGVYLWHYPVARLTRDVLPPWEAFAITAGISIMLAGLTFYVVEEPTRRYLEHKLNLRRASLAAA